MVDEATAREAAEAVIAGWNSPAGPGEEIVITKVDEHSRAWVFHFATRRWTQTGEFGYQLVGTCPLVVDKATGQLHQYGSGPDGYEQFTAWLDAETG